MWTLTVLGILWHRLSVISLSYLVAVPNDGQNLDAKDAADTIAEDEDATPDEDDEDDSDDDVPEEDESSVSESEDSENSPSSDDQGISQFQQKFSIPTFVLLAHANISVSRNFHKSTLSQYCIHSVLLYPLRVINWNCIFIG